MAESALEWKTAPGPWFRPYSTHHTPDGLAGISLQAAIKYRADA